jgi:4-carboxymuconolactone decarboxylase
MDKPFGIAPLAPPYSPEVKEMLEKWMPPGAGVAPLALFRTLQRNGELANRMRPLGGFLLGKGRLPARDRELAILRTCVRTGAEYEWGVHAQAFARGVGIDAAQLAATCARAPGTPLETPDLALLQIVDELHDVGTVSDAAWQRVAGRFDDEQRLELLVLVGFYHLISFVANGARVELEPWALRWRAAGPEVAAGEG